MQYIENKTDMVMKYKALFNLLNGQNTIMESIVKDALRRNQVEGDNDRQLIEGFFTLIEAIEKVVTVQQILTTGEKPTQLANYLKNLKNAFKAMDMAMVDGEDTTVKQAMNERKNSTIH